MAIHTLKLIAQGLDWVRGAAAVQVGIYGMPIREYWAAFWYQRLVTQGASRDDFKKWSSLYIRLIEADQLIRTHLVDHVDYVAPSLYTFYNDPETWVPYARDNLQRAAFWGKPVIPFLWMDYHNSTPLTGQRLNPAFWRTQERTVRQLADGVVIWGGFHWGLNQTPTQETWSDTDPWWLITQEELLK